MIFACGRFDILHPGHIKLLQIAKDLATGTDDNLVIAINSDKSCEALGKPAMMSEHDRMSLITSLSFFDDCVNATIFNETDAREIVKKNREHESITWVLGDDHRNEDFSGLKDVQIIFVKRSNHSSSAIKEKMKCQ